MKNKSVRNGTNFKYYALLLHFKQEIWEGGKRGTKHLNWLSPVRFSTSSKKGLFDKFS